MSPSLRAVAGALLFTLPLLRAQQFSFPDCVNQCIDQSTDNSCSITDVKCICRQSNGRFLPDMAACIKAECDNNISIDALLTPLEFVCRIAGTPVSQSALDNARNMISVEPVTTTVFAPSPSLTTVTTTEDGKNIVIVYPITAPASNDDESQQATVTRFPPGTTVTETRPDGEAQTTLVPVIVVTVDNDGSSHTITQSETRTVTATATGSLDPTNAAEDTTLTTSVETATTTASESATGTASDDQADTTSTVTSGEATTTAEATDGANDNANKNPGGGDKGAPYGTSQGDARSLVPNAATAFAVAVVFAGLMY